MMNNLTLTGDITESRLEELIQMALQIGAGAIDVVAVSPSDISVEDDLANYCREPRCPYYGLSANCPPHVLVPSEFRDLLKTCEHALAIKIDVPMGCLLTDERNEIFKLLHEIVADIENAAIELGYANSKAFATGSCKIIFCHEYGSCRVIEGGECRNSQYARPSANGLNVNELNKITGWSINRDTNKTDTDRVSMAAVLGLVLVG